MIGFKEYLIEQQENPDEGKKLKHLTHVEDHIIHGGHEGAALAAEHLENLHDKFESVIKFEKHKNFSSIQETL